MNASRKRNKYFKRPAYLFVDSNNYVVVKKGKFVSERQKQRVERSEIEKAQHKLGVKSLIIVGILIILGAYVIDLICYALWGI